MCIYCTFLSVYVNLKGIVCMQRLWVCMCMYANAGLRRCGVERGWPGHGLNVLGRSFAMGAGIKV